MASPDLFESAWMRAKRECAAVYRSPSFALTIVVLGLLAAAIAGLEAPGDGDTERRVLLPLAIGLVAAALGHAAVLAFELSVAPYRQRDELRKAWPISDSVDPAVALLDLRRRGRDLLAGLGSRDFSLDGDAVEGWTLEVGQLLGTGETREQLKRFLNASNDKRGPVPALQSRLAALDQIIQGQEELNPDD